MPVLKSIKKASPIGLKITLRSVTSPNNSYKEFMHIYSNTNLTFFSIIFFQIREGKAQTLSECLRREFRITINTLRTLISYDLYEVIYFF